MSETETLYMEARVVVISCNRDGRIRARYQVPKSLKQALGFRMEITEALG